MYGEGVCALARETYSLGHKNIKKIFLAINSILQDCLACPNSSRGDSNGILPLPGLERILEELLQEDGYVSITVSFFLFFFFP